MSAANFSAGTDPQQAQSELDVLSKPRGKWTLTGSGTGVERSFRFKTFKAAWTFMNDVAGECKKAKHHPEWSNVYNRVFIRWTTHNPAGLSEVDIKMAKLCDELAQREQSFEVEGADEDIQTLKAAADTVVASAGDCCTPKAPK